MTTPAERQTVEALLRTNFHAFLGQVFRTLNPDTVLSKAPYLEAMAFELQEAAGNPGSRLLVTVPPRHLKSISAAVALPAFLLGRDPARKILVVFYGDELSREHATNFRTVIESGWYRRLFPQTRIHRRNNRTSDIRTTQGGARKSVSLGGALTGFGADLIVIDDLMKAGDAHSDVERARVKTFFRETLYSRLNNKAKGQIIAIQQRLHEDDFAAYLKESASFGHLNLPAFAEQETLHPLYFDRAYRRRVGDVLDPEREPAETLENIRAQIGAYAFSAQYQQNPVPPESMILNFEKISWIEHSPPRRHMKRIVQSWDTAIKDNPDCDFSVCTTWGWDGRWHLLHVHRERLEFPDLKMMALKLAGDWRAEKVLIEDAGTGASLVHQLRVDGHHKFMTFRPRGSKRERLAAQSDILQSDRVALPLNEPWSEAFRHELRAFPSGRYDDQVDSVTQFLEWAQGRRARGFLERDPVTGRCDPVRRGAEADENRRLVF